MEGKMPNGKIQKYILVAIVVITVLGVAGDIVSPEGERIIKHCTLVAVSLLGWLHNYGRAESRGEHRKNGDNVLAIKDAVLEK